MSSGITNVFSKFSKLLEQNSWLSAALVYMPKCYLGISPVCNTSAIGIIEQKVIYSVSILQLLIKPVEQIEKKKII